MLAYGMNSNIEQMAKRCPNAVSLGRYDLKNHRLVFRGVADVEVSDGDVTQCVLWDITDQCEENLDALENYPFFYGKKYTTVTLNGEMRTAMYYKMTEGHVNYYPPNSYYRSMLEEGYKDHGLDIEQIYGAEGFEEDYECVYDSFYR